MSEREPPGEARGMGRRDFLASTAAAGAGVLLGRAAASEDPSPRASGFDDLNVALIGLGAQGMVLMDACLRIPGIRFKAVCDIWSYSQQRGSRTLKRYGHLVNVYEDYREMLAQESDLDAAIVATPDWMHAEHALACMKAGLHVYCEKEMSNSAEKARQMALTARKTGKLLQIGHQRRSNPRYVHAIDRMIRTERLLGRVTQAYGQWNRAVSEDLGWPKNHVIDQETLEKYGYESMHHFRNWRWYRKYVGGPIVDLGSHQIDIFSWALDARPKSVMAGGGVDYFPHHEWYDNVMAIFEYDTASGVSRGLYQVLTTTSNGGFFESFMGENGALVISEVPYRGNHFLRENHVPQSEWEKLAQQRLLLKAEEEQTVAEPTDDIIVDVRVTVPLGAWSIPVELNKPVHQPHLENFFDAIRRGVPLNCPPEMGYETAVAVLRVNDAVESQQRLEFTPQDFVISA